MTCQIPTECLNEILEYLEEDKLTLYSCLLVNRLWCKIAVIILWRNILNFKRVYKYRSLRVAKSILSTLIACLPNESKELLYKNEIFIPTPTSNSPLFNYPEFSKVLSINEITEIVNDVLKNRNGLVINEIIKIFTTQISSLKKFTYCYNYYYHLNISFPNVPEARDLSELCCSSNLSSDFFYQLSQICHNLQSISILFDEDDDDDDDDVLNELNELKVLIFSQNNLKYLTLSAFGCNSWEYIIPAIIKHSHTITKLRLYGEYSNLPFSFINSFTNLQEFIFSFLHGNFKDFERLQYANFSKLEILKIPYQCPKPEYIMKFLENNGKNLKKFHVNEKNKALNLSIANFCPKIRNLFVILDKSEIDTLKNIFISCKYLESITILCDYCEDEVLNTVLNYSSNNFHELKLVDNYYDTYFDVSPKVLESFFVSWRNRTPKKLLSLIFIGAFTNKENLKIIEKYENLGIIKFCTKSCDEDDEEEEIDFHY
jgi:hypothetical protein